MVSLSFRLKSGVTGSSSTGTALINIADDIKPAAVISLSPLFFGASGAIYTDGGIWIEVLQRNIIKYYGSTTNSLLYCNIVYMIN